MDVSAGVGVNFSCVVRFLNRNVMTPVLLQTFDFLCEVTCESQSSVNGEQSVKKLAIPCTGESFLTNLATDRAEWRQPVIL